MARLVALAACIAAGAASAALGGSARPVTWGASHAQLLSPTFGYAEVSWQGGTVEPASGGGLYLYRDGRWSKTRWGGVDDVAFPDDRHGWITTYDCARARVGVFRTGDGGATWVRLPVRTTHSCGGGPTYLSFPNDRDGWLETVDPNGPGGGFLITANGGISWPRSGGLGQATPGTACLKRITALSATTAWMPCGQLLRTTNGGMSWRPQRLPLPDGWRHHAVTNAGTPRFFGRHGVVAVTAWSRQAKAVLFYTTADGGRTWSLRARRPIADVCRNSFPWPTLPEAEVSIASPTTWWLVSNWLGRVDVTRDGGGHWQSHSSATLRKLGWCHVASLTAGSGSFAWVTTNNRQRSALYETRNSGRAWRPVTFPLR